MANWNARIASDVQHGKLYTNSVESFEPTIYAGSWCIGGNFYINIKEKPTNEQIKNTEQLLGWKWKDAK